MALPFERTKDLKETMRTKTDEELFDVLFAHYKNYTLDALGVAREEFTRRQLDEATMRHDVAAAKTVPHGKEPPTNRPGQGSSPSEKAEMNLGTDLTPLFRSFLERLSMIERGVWTVLRGLWTVVVYLCFLAVAAGMLYDGYQWIDDHGWVSHQEDTSISVSSNWLVGETKECVSVPLSSEAAVRLGKHVGYAMSDVSCGDDAQTHQIKVTFYGRAVQPGYNFITWRCQRNLVSFTCYQTGGK